MEIVFHSAATIKFDEDLTVATELNVGAVLTLLRICREMAELRALVHISTAYCNTHQFNITEEILPQRVDPAGLVQLCKVKFTEICGLTLFISLIIFSLS